MPCFIAAEHEPILKFRHTYTAATIQWNPGNTTKYKRIVCLGSLIINIIILGSFSLSFVFVKRVSTVFSGHFNNFTHTPAITLYAHIDIRHTIIHFTSETDRSLALCRRRSQRRWFRDYRQYSRCSRSRPAAPSRWWNVRRACSDARSCLPSSGCSPSPAATRAATRATPGRQARDGPATTAAIRQLVIVEKLD